MFALTGKGLAWQARLGWFAPVAGGHHATQGARLRDFLDSGFLKGRGRL